MFFSRVERLLEQFHKTRFVLCVFVCVTHVKPQIHPIGPGWSPRLESQLCPDSQVVRVVPTAVH